MSDPGFGYSLITPARDEPDNLRRLADCLAQQTRAPIEWIIVDNGSTDETPAVAREIAGRLDFAWAIAIDGTETATPGAPVVRAFHAGIAAAESDADVVVKLDADVSMDPDYFERLVGAFERNPRLGIASGVCLERAGERWAPVSTTIGHVRGATRAYRKECLADVLPLEERMGWDGIDELKANVCGWITGTVTGVAFRHHRRVGERDGARTRRWEALGRSSHYMGYRPSYLFARALFHARRDRAALAMIRSYCRASLARAPRYQDEVVRAHLRNRQRWRQLWARFEEARGLRSRLSD
jgi:poly-beta-1,6-N-acetyl-D-glucosamine synthase